MKKISIVVAAFNEEANLKELTSRLISVLRNKYDYEIVYYIAGTDNSLNVVKKFHNPRIKIIYSKKPHGLGNDFKIAFKNVSEKSDYIITMDADINHRPEDIPRMIQSLKDNDIVIGSRLVKGGSRDTTPIWKRLVSDIANITVGIFTRMKVKDKTSGFRLYRNDALRKIYPKYESKNFEFLLEMLLIANKYNMKIVEIPITLKYRVAGKSNFRLIRTAFGYLRLLTKYLFKKV